MKKKFMGIIISAAVLGAVGLAACSPKEEVAWITGFSIEYSFVTNTYDGSTRNLTVKDMQAFEEYLITVDGYDGKMQLADSEVEAFMYTVEGAKFYIANINDDVYYMSACSYTIYSEKDDAGNREKVNFVFPPVSKDYVFSDMSGLNLEVIQNWDYFCNFYSDYEGAVIDGDGQTIIVNGDYKGGVTLKYENNVIYFSYVFDGES